MKKPQTNQNDYYTFIMLPHAPHRGMRQIRLPARLVHAVVLIIVFVSAFLAGSVGYNAFLTTKTLKYKLELELVSAKARKIDQFLKQSNELKSVMLDLHLRNNQLRELLGLNAIKPGPGLARVVGRDLNLQESTLLAKSEQEQLKKFKEHVSEVYQKMSFIPSKWPIYGKIVSGYGYRVSPWVGLHQGVDIDASFGYPIRATAPGVVSFSGWRQGYGKTIEINHKFGYSSLYGHCSILLVENGDAIKSGQIIARVGNTGYSTGTHLHYEVRKDNRPISPIAFLGLKTLTAVRILK